MIQRVVLLTVTVTLALIIGSAEGFIAGGNRHPAPAGSTTPGQYASVRAANIGPLEQALSRVPPDCSGNDRGRCTLSIAYALALTQKFKDELVPAPSCLEPSDSRLRTALTELDVSLHTAALDNAFGRTQLLGMGDLKASDSLFVTEPCANAIAPSPVPQAA